MGTVLTKSGFKAITTSTSKCQSFMFRSSAGQQITMIKSLKMFLMFVERYCQRSHRGEVKSSHEKRFCRKIIFSLSNSCLTKTKDLTWRATCGLWSNQYSKIFDLPIVAWIFNEVLSFIGIQFWGRTFDEKSSSTCCRDQNVPTFAYCSLQLVLIATLFSFFTLADELG